MREAREEEENKQRMEDEERVNWEKPEETIRIASCQEFQITAHP